MLRFVQSFWTMWRARPLDPLARFAYLGTKPHPLGLRVVGAGNPWRAGHTRRPTRPARCREAAVSILRVTDDSDRDELAEALGHCCRTAIRAPHVISQDPLRPSAWDVCHLRLNALLDEWEAAR